MGLSRPKYDQSVSEINFQFTFDHDEEFVRAWMLVPAIFPLEHRNAKAVIIDIGQDEVVMSRQAFGGRSKIDDH